MKNSGIERRSERESQRFVYLAEQKNCVADNLTEEQLCEQESPCVE